MVVMEEKKESEPLWTEEENQGEVYTEPEGQKHNPFTETGTENHPKYLTFLVLSIMSCCCLCIPLANPLTGLVALIFVFLGNSDHKAGRVKEAEEKFRIAKIALIVGAGFNLIMIILNCMGVFNPLTQRFLKDGVDIIRENL